MTQGSLRRGKRVRIIVTDSAVLSVCDLVEMAKNFGKNEVRKLQQLALARPSKERRG